ncbi:MAG: hypothetical protein FWG98_04055 [Candidatus Cloacimonetes bacterium]|nr:hypothetical protein [Candidatus Cloacimonadota bacterium]
MGTQQILMIVLSVIVVGSAVAVGIQMFDTQANNQARNAIVSDLMSMAVQAQAWWRTPVVMGGPVGGAITSTNLPELVRFINLAWNGVGPHTNPTANYTFAVDSPTSIKIRGESIQNPEIVAEATIELRGGNIDDSYGINIVNVATP